MRNVPLGSTLGATLLSISSALAAPQATLPHGVAAGDVSASAGILWARASAPGTITFEISTDRLLVTSVRSFSMQVTDATVPAKQAVRGLTPRTRYFYRATDSTGAQSVGTFVTPDPIGVRDGFRFGVTGDSRGDNGPFRSLLNVVERQPEVFVLLGDTIYADIESPALPGVAQASTPAEFRGKHIEIHSEMGGINPLVALRRSVAVLATIDDHEVTNDFAGGAAPSTDPRFQDVGQFINETPLFQMGMRAFLDYYPVGERLYAGTGDARLEGKRKLYTRQWYGSDAAIHVLDARSFRDQELADANLADPADVTRFLVESFDPTRTMLGRAQVNELKADLLEAQTAGIQWKFVMVPEPIQNLGPAAASDRFEGYAAERNEILAFIDANDITNVVFVAADIHGTVVNDVNYQAMPGGPQVPSGAFEISTGAIAFDAPFGPTVVQLASALGLLSPSDLAIYQSLGRDDKDLFVAGLVNLQTMLFGYTPVGIEPGGAVNATLLQGGWTVTHTWGWTEFDIAPGTQELRITTYGVEPGDLTALPEVISEFVVTPQTGS